MILLLIILLFNVNVSRTVVNHFALTIASAVDVTRTVVNHTALSADSDTDVSGAVAYYIVITVASQAGVAGTVVNATLLLVMLILIALQFLQCCYNCSLVCYFWCRKSTFSPRAFSIIAVVTYFDNIVVVVAVAVSS